MIPKLQPPRRRRQYALPSIRIATGLATLTLAATAGSLAEPLSPEEPWQAVVIHNRSPELPGSSAPSVAVSMHTLDPHTAPHSQTATETDPEPLAAFLQSGRDHRGSTTPIPHALYQRSQMPEEEERSQAAGDWLTDSPATSPDADRAAEWGWLAADVWRLRDERATRREAQTDRRGTDRDGETLEQGPFALDRAFETRAEGLDREYERDRHPSRQPAVNARPDDPESGVEDFLLPNLPN